MRCSVLTSSVVGEIQTRIRGGRAEKRCFCFLYGHYTRFRLTACVSRQRGKRLRLVTISGVTRQHGHKATCFGKTASASWPESKACLKWSTISRPMHPRANAAVHHRIIPSSTRTARTMGPASKLVRGEGTTARDFHYTSNQAGLCGPSSFMLECSGCEAGERSRAPFLPGADRTSMPGRRGESELLRRAPSRPFQHRVALFDRSEPLAAAYTGPAIAVYNPRKHGVSSLDWGAWLCFTTCSWKPGGKWFV